MQYQVIFLKNNQFSMSSEFKFRNENNLEIETFFIPTDKEESIFKDPDSFTFEVTFFPILYLMP